MTEVRKYLPLATVAEMHELKGKEIFLFCAKAEKSIVFMGCESLKELGDYMEELLPSVDFGRMNPENCALIRGDLLDPEYLPYELDYGDEAFVLFNDWSLHRFSKMEAVTSFVEFAIASSSVDIDRFAIISGRVLPVNMVVGLLTRVDKLRSSILVECTNV